MYDSRFNKMAQVIVHYSIEVRPGQTVYVWGQTPAAPLMLEIYREILKAGGNAFLRADLPGAQEIFYAHAQDAQLDFVSPVDRISVEEGEFDAYIRIGAETNTRRLSNADPAKIRRHQAAMSPILTRRLQRSAKGNYNWCVTQFPTDAYAMDADMSLAEYTEFVFGACLVNDPDPVARWREVGATQQRYVDFLRDKKVLRVQGANADLTLRIEGRTWKNSQGKRNFPDGEIFTGPHEDSVNGWVRYSYPAIYQGREVSGIQLWFEDGRVVKATADKNEDFLHQVLDTDRGARYVGEFAIGTNYGITRFSRNILFDEKIGGTFHIAVGAGYPDTGSTNTSAVHWDMIASAHDAEISADGEVFYRNGQFLI
ncbi:MAG: aminopeptidase [Candidatus Roseilinea sp.]|nr:MAG: aminopeptidase [Candidatus Roseilinea sp.]GIV84006.1 MAG: aminopeptidase [Candidatus Roseilinea sp.]